MSSPSNATENLNSNTSTTTMVASRNQSEFAGADLMAIEHLAKLAANRQPVGDERMRFTQAIEIRPSVHADTTLALAKQLAMVHVISDFAVPEDDGPLRNLQFFCKKIGDALFYRIWPHVGQPGSYATVWPRPANMVLVSDPEWILEDRLQVWLSRIADNGLFACTGYKTSENSTLLANDLAKRIGKALRTAEDTSLWWFQVTPNRREMLIGA